MVPGLLSNNAPSLKRLIGPFLLRFKPREGKRGGGVRSSCKWSFVCPIIACKIMCTKEKGVADPLGTIRPRHTVLLNEFRLCHFFFQSSEKVSKNGAI